jgi:mannonate dehydratase
MKITRVKATLTTPAGIALVVVKVETDQPGLYGLGCATFTQRCTIVARAVDEYLDPLLRGRDPDNIEDLWRLMHHNSSWRWGPVLNSAHSGVDQALWDLKGKVAGQPVYELLGGKCRPAAMIYRHADGHTPGEVLDNVRMFQASGALAVRCQIGGYGGRFNDQPALTRSFPGAYYDPDRYARSVVDLFDHIRAHIGDNLFLLHDIHERLAPIDAIRLAKALEPHRLFFLEDPLAPDQVEWFRRLRQQTTTPIAMGELHTHPLEWRPLVSEQLIDFIRAHISAIGGLTPARKLAALCESFGVRTAWHGPGDVSPIGHAANLHLDLACHNFGIQEVVEFNDATRAVFPGAPEIRGGHVWANDRPGFGVDFNEVEAAKYPVTVAPPIQWTQSRWPDGTIWTP